MVSDIKRLQKQFKLTEGEAKQLFREGELTRITSKRNGDKINVTLSHTYQTGWIPATNKDQTK